MKHTCSWKLESASAGSLGNYQ